MARAGFDFLWIEMQHSPLTFQEVAQMIWSARDLPAVPFIRVPDATEGDIQKATDVGALGIIVPMVVEVAKAEAAVRFAKYPPEGVRSLGGGQYGGLYGRDYRATANENIMVVAMIESPAGVENAEAIASVPGVDVVFTAATDLFSFSGHAQGEPEYEAMISKIHTATLIHIMKQNTKLKHGIITMCIGTVIEAARLFEQVQERCASITKWKP